ncbi:hypothetical protein [Amycolatopsis jejuensis]|uniref:hypothetical protein n=1 Tax=Amycolatopsis jejuensis TaxID=330084 RepID=UPI0005252326|nr:hypothetical protein [Amycolatopsis jejuensis]
MNADPMLVVYRDDIGAFDEMLPSFLLKVTGVTGLESVTVQWPDEATVEQKARVLQFVATAAGKGRQPHLVHRQGRKTSILADALPGFVAAVDGKDWWLGNLALVFGGVDHPGMVWLPGSDGLFLYVAAPPTDLDFYVVPSVQEISFGLGWVTEVE